jgi:hypothetical protein
LTLFGMAPICLFCLRFVCVLFIHLQFISLIGICDKKFKQTLVEKFKATLRE